MAYAPAAPCVCVIFIYYSEITCCGDDRVKSQIFLMMFPDIRWYQRVKSGWFAMAMRLAAYANVDAAIQER